VHRIQTLVLSVVFLLVLGGSGHAVAVDAGLAAGAAESGAVSEPAPAPTLRWATSFDVSKGNYRWSLTRGAFDIGVRFDAPREAGRAVDLRLDRAGPPWSMLPAVSFGLRSVAAKADAPATSLIERAAGAPAGEAYVSKIAIEWKPAPSRLFINNGLGIRLDGDDRLTMRMRKGSLGVYMQRNF
jgi:hypothetical protein